MTSISSVSSAEEKLNESTRGILGGFPSFSGRRTSGGNFSGSVLGSFSVSGGGNEAMGNAQAAAHEAELEEFLATTCGMKHMFGRFRACGVESVTQLCAELNSPAIPDAVTQKLKGAERGNRGSARAMLGISRFCLLDKSCGIPELI